MSARMLFSAAMAMSAYRARLGERPARGCPVAEEAMVHFLGMDEADRRRVEPHFASFLRLRVASPAAAEAEAWAAYDALGAPRPKAGHLRPASAAAVRNEPREATPKMLPGDWRGRADCGVG